MYILLLIDIPKWNLVYQSELLPLNEENKDIISMSHNLIYPFPKL